MNVSVTFIFCCAWRWKKEESGSCDQLYFMRTCLKWPLALWMCNYSRHVLAYLVCDAIKRVEKKGVKCWSRNSQSNLQHCICSSCKYIYIHSYSYRSAGLQASKCVYALNLYNIMRNIKQNWFPESILTLTD